MLSEEKLGTLDLPLPVDKLKRTLRDYGVTKAFVFGSYARHEQRLNSDFDLYIECKPGVSLFDVFDLQLELQRQSGVLVDLVTKINPNFLEYIEPELIEVIL